VRATDANERLERSLDARKEAATRATEERKHLLEQAQASARLADSARADASEARTAVSEHKAAVEEERRLRK